MASPWVERARVHAVLADPHRLAVLHHVALGDRSPRDLAELLGLSMPLLSHHLNALTEAGLITRTTSEQDRRKRFVSLDVSAHGYLDRRWLQAQLPTKPSRVVFACTHNSARSVLASALWTQRTKGLSSAGGTDPGDRIHPGTRRVARNHGLRLLQQRPQALAPELGDGDLLITVCDAADARVPEHPHRLHWSIRDPARDRDPAAFERVFSALTERISRLEFATQPSREEPGNDE